MPHLQPPEVGSLREDVVAELSRAAEQQGFISQMRQTLALRPAILRAVNDLTFEVMRSTTIDGELKSLVALVSSVAAGCRHCQAHTALRSSNAGASVEKINAVWEFESSPLFDDAERAALRMARDASVAPSAVTSAHFDELTQFFDDGEIVELLSVICLFGWNNRWNDAMATATEDEALGFARSHLGAAWEIGKHGRDE